MELISLAHEQMIENKKKEVIELMKSKGFKLIEDDKIFPRIDNVDYIIDISSNSIKSIRFILSESSEVKMRKLKQPKIFEETERFTEVEIPEGKREEYDLNGYELSGKGEDGKGNYFEYFIKHNDHKGGINE